VKELGSKNSKEYGVRKSKGDKNLGGEMKGTGSSEEGMEGTGS
jgi:hypothetical protein